MRSRLTTFACLLATTAFACQVVLGLEEPKQGERQDAAVIDPCVHAHPPPRPEAGARGAEESYWMVMSAIVFPAVDEAGAARGYDLDEACTCVADLHDGASPCRTFGGRACDHPSGIDNTFATTLMPYGTLIDLAAASNKVGNRSGRGILVYLSSYNGEANDDDVGLTVIPTEGLFSNLGCDGLPRPDAEVTPGEYATPLTPTHDGCDHWKIKEELLTITTDGIAPLGGILSKGYVSGWRLVAPSKTTILPLAGRALRANDTILTGHLEPVMVAGRRVFRLTDGLGVARSPMSNFVDLLAQTRVNGNEADELCLNQLWSTVKQTLCESLDTMTTPAGDFQGESCNAFSVTWGFTGHPIYLDDAGRNLRPDPPGVDCGVVATPEQLCGVAP
jgi:hypothetical protein